MKSRIPSLLVLFSLLTATAPVTSLAQTAPPKSPSGRPVDPKAIENLNRINDDRVKRGLKPIDAPGYTYVPADQRAKSEPDGSTNPDPEAASAPEELRWVVLVNRPELWPAQCTMKRTIAFEGGVTIKAGQKVKVDLVTLKEVELSTLDDKTQFAAAPGETDVFEVAQAEYAKLSPQQRSLTYESLVYRRELWPYRVKITQTFDLGRSQRIQSGDEAVLLSIERGKLLVLAEKFRTTFNVAPSATDLMAQARKFLAEKDGAPSRVVAELDGKLVSSVTGKPDPLPAGAQPQYIVYYRGSSTCPITRQFTPTLVKYDRETKPKHPEYEIVYIMTETPENTGKFAKELGFSWRAVEYETTGKMPVSNSEKVFSNLIPQLVVMDRTGKVLANGIQGSVPEALRRLDALLQQTPTSSLAVPPIRIDAIAASASAAVPTKSAKIPLPPTPATLAWRDLINHPERWPDTTKTKVGLKFSSGALPVGSAVRIDAVTATEVQLIAPQGFVFKVKPENCDLLEAANVQWSKFTPEQRALTAQTLAADPTLWPGKVKILEEGIFGSLRISPGSELPVISVKATEVGVVHPKSQDMLMFNLNYTDIISRARELALLPDDKRPGRMAASLEGVTVDVSGKPTAVPQADYYVFYFASSTCPRCKVFTPEFLEHFSKNLASRTDVAFVSWPTDSSTPPYLQYARANKIPWPTLPVDRKRLFVDLGMFEIPGILVVDRFGNRLLASNQTPGAPLDAAKATLAKLDDVLKPQR